MYSSNKSDAERAWLRLLPDADFRLPMNLRVGDATRYWSRSGEAATVLAERARWIVDAPQRHVVFLDQAAETVREAVTWLGQASGMQFADAHAAACGLEPDWVLLSGDSERGFPVGAWTRNWAIRWPRPIVLFLGWSQRSVDRSPPSWNAWRQTLRGSETTGG